MADEHAPKPQRGWRDALAAAGGGKGGPAWKGSVDAAKGVKQPWSRKTRLQIALGLFGAVIGAIVLLLFLFRPVKPFRLVVLSAGYETNLAIPHNVPGRKAAADLVAWGKEQSRVEIREGPLTLDLSALKEATDGCKAQTVVVCINAHGGADDEGVFFVPQDADLKDRARARLRLEQILTQLNTLPAETRKLLIVDATQVSASWTVGFFHNDFARQFKGLEDRIKQIPGLVVLMASAENQRSWVSEEWRQSIFAHHVLEGLRGAADPGTKRISAYDLYRHVADKVKLWARDNRGALQTPILLGGDERAQAMELVAVAKAYQPPDPLLQKSPVLPPSLENAWAERDRLAAQTPPPAVYTPQVWRQYEETLLRYEQLLRADDRAAAEVVLAEAPRLQQKIAAARVRKLDSALGTLAMPAALGWDTPPLDDARTAEVKALLEKGGQQAALKEKLSGWLGAEKELWKKQLLRVRLAGLLLQLAADDPARNLTEVRKLLTAPEDVSAARPAEAQYLVLLERDLAAPPQWALVKDALLLRRQAEEAAVGLSAGEGPGAVPLAEVVLPWTRADLDKADRERRLGQDLLLATADKDRKEAADRLGKARDLYKTAQETAARVRRALLLRDRVQADLPYYSQWLAGRRFIGDGELGKRLLEPIDANLRLWDAVNALDQALVDPPPGADPTLDKTTEAVARDFAALEKEFAARCNQDHAIRQENWHELDGLLTVPLIPAKRRLELLSKLQKISSRLNEETEKAGGQEGMTADQTKLLAREGARAQGKMALSALGKKAFDMLKGPGDYDKTRQGIWAAPEGSWQPDLNLAGDAVGRRLTQAPGDADQYVKLSRTFGLTEALKLIPRLDAATRRLPGALAAWLTTDPVEETRRLQLHDLLCLQGERTFQDFLAADGAGQGGPYYQVAGIVYHDDALAQIQAPGAVADKAAPTRRERVARLKEALTDKERALGIAWSLNGHTFQPAPAKVPLTDEEEVPLWYAVQSAKVPDGYPVLWPKLEDKEEFLQPAAAVGRAVQRGLGGEPGKAAAVYPVVRRPHANAPPRPQEATQWVHARFRGHQLLAETKIDHFGVPDAAAALPALPTFGRLAVQTTPAIYQKYGEGNGAIVLVLDCSGSMAAKQADGTTRFDQARLALKQVLASIPRGTQVSVWVFSQQFDVRNGANLGNSDPEDTIQRLYFAKKWDKKMLAELGPRIDALSYWNETPIVRAMMEARKDFRDEQGFKTMVILTDGMDNRFEPQANGWRGDPVFNPNGKYTIPQFLAERFGKGSDILVRIIGFQLPPGERPIAERQFKQPLAQLPKKGRFYDVTRAPDLIEALKESVQQRLFFSLQDNNGQPVKGYKKGVDINMMGTNRHVIELPPGYYYVDIDTTQLRQKIEIRRGDFLRLNLFQVRDGFVLQRDLIEKSFPGAGIFPTKETKEWRVTVLQNERKTTEPAAEQMVAIEYLKEREFGGEGVLSQVTPSLILFRVKRADDPKAAPLSLRFRPLAAYAAPSWELQVRPWQREHAPQLEVFWSEDPPEKAKVLRRGQHFEPLDEKWTILPAGAAFKAPLNAAGEEGTVRLLSLRTEKHTVDTYEGKPRKDVSCFVVRMSYPPGKPVMVQLPGWSGGQEHRFYNTAGKYTGIFWEMTAQDAQNRVENLNMISLEAFREAAVSSRQHVRMDLKPPDLTQRPPPQ